MASKTPEYVDAGTQTLHIDQLHQQRQRFVSSTRSVRRKLGDFKRKLSRISDKSEPSGGDGESYNSPRPLSSIGLAGSKGGSIDDSKNLYTPTSWDDCEISGDRSNCSEGATSNTDELAKAIPQLPIFKRWSDEEIKLQREVIEKYEAGVRLWTKEKLLDMENMIAGRGGIVRTSLYAGSGDYIAYKEPGNLYKVDFHGYQAMAFPLVTRPEGMAYSSMTISEKAAYTYVPKDLDEQEEKFTQCQAAWDENQVGQHFYSTFMRLPFPPYINKIVCIGLGNFVAPGSDDENTVMLNLSMIRHAAVVTVAEVLFKRFGRQIQILAQDVHYTPDCAAILFRKGFSVVGRYGAGGFAEIDDKTFVFAPPSIFCLKEIVADIAKPAAMFWGTILTPTEIDISSRAHQLVTFGEDITSFWNYHIADFDTPRVRILAKEYDEYQFPYTNLFGQVSIYTLRGMSIANTKSEDETS
ncbi:hypothetical protein F4813DRAFT_399067 [Daldinia decipiens]|uniref:uncharacterized protein n=1 Tax=Daldinia decipiens TaxID=326647 RepID=UPI0020C491E8|nr:uncharacterized protein F4813DRAFT_399067 [Daldinia decipiens]KAI1654346.1 hypothetical protein F4813DRAFT_399067 [Daldinia decipiens]